VMPSRPVTAEGDIQSWRSASILEEGRKVLQFKSVISIRGHPNGQQHLSKRQGLCGDEARFQVDTAFSRSGWRNNEAPGWHGQRRGVAYGRLAQPDWLRSIAASSPLQQEEMAKKNRG